jgi:hypothetical protein
MTKPSEKSTGMKCASRLQAIEVFVMLLSSCFVSLALALVEFLGGEVQKAIL